MTAMAVDSGDDREPAGTLLAAARAVASACVVTALLLLGVLTLLGSAEWWRGFVPATVAALMAAVATLPVIAWGMRVAASRPELAAGAFFAAAGLRALIALGAAMLAVRHGGYPKTPTLLLVVPYYFALLSAETFVLVRLLWKSGPAAGPRHDSTDTKHD
jgi:hypothetical protein